MRGNDSPLRLIIRSGLQLRLHVDASIRRNGDIAATPIRSR
jgi:hypothetical protein